MTYGEQLPTDSASKKFLGVLHNDGGVNVFHAIRGANRQAQNGEWVADMAVEPNSTGDDNTAFSLLTGKVLRALGGVFSPVVAELGTNMAGLARLTKRRAQIVGVDQRICYGYSLDVSGIGDIQGSTTNQTTGFATPTTAFFDGADVGFTGSARFLRFPMEGWAQGATIALYHNLAVDCDVTLYADVSPQDGLGSMVFQVDTFTMPSGNTAIFAPYYNTANPATYLRAVPQLLMPVRYWVVGLDPASDPAAGQAFISVVR